MQGLDHVRLRTGYQRYDRQRYVLCDPVVSGNYTSEVDTSMRRVSKTSEMIFAA
jgi:hypothetical protein